MTEEEIECFTRFIYADLLNMVEKLKVRGVNVLNEKSIKGMMEAKKKEEDQKEALAQKCEKASDVRLNKLAVWNRYTVFPNGKIYSV